MIFIFSIVLDAEYLSYVKSIATYAPTFFGYIISALASVRRKRRILTTQNESTTNSMFFRSREKKLQFLRDDLRNASFCFEMF